MSIATYTHWKPQMHPDWVTVICMCIYSSANSHHTLLFPLLTVRPSLQTEQKVLPGGSDLIFISRSLQQAISQGLEKALYQVALSTISATAVFEGTQVWKHQTHREKCTSICPGLNIDILIHIQVYTFTYFTCCAYFLSLISLFVCEAFIWISWKKYDWEWRHNETNEVWRQKAWELLCWRQLMEKQWERKVCFSD